MSFPGVKCGGGLLLTTHLLLVPRSRKSRAIPLNTLPFYLLLSVDGFGPFHFSPPWPILRYEALLNAGHISIFKSCHSRPHILLHLSCSSDRSSLNKRKMVMSTLQKSSQRSGSFHYTWTKIPTYKLHLYCPFQSYKDNRVTAIDRAI